MKHSRFDLNYYYDDFPQVEDAFQADLDQSLEPRGPDFLFSLMETLKLPTGATIADVGCGEGKHSIELARRFRFEVRGFDPVDRHIELADEKLSETKLSRPEAMTHVSFALGYAESLPLDSASVDAIWCRDVLVHVEDLAKAYAEFNRVLRPGGRVLVYQMFGTEALEPQERSWLFQTMGVVPSSADSAVTDSAIKASGLHVDERIELGTEWGQFQEEKSGKGSRQLVHAARRLSDPERYKSKFGPAAYDIMLGDCYWHIYRMIGKLSPKVYLLSKSI